MPVVIMLMFVYMLGDAFNVGVDYVDYATPGLILLAVCYGLGATATSVNSDMTKGIINRFKVMDVSRGAVLTGHVDRQRADQPGRHRGAHRGGLPAGIQPVGELRSTGSAWSASSCCSASRPAGSPSPWDWRRSPRRRRAWPPCRWSCCRSSAARSCRRTRWGRACGSSRSTSPSRRSSRPCAGCSTARRTTGDVIAAFAWCRRDRPGRVPVGAFDVQEASVTSTSSRQLACAPSCVASVNRASPRRRRAACSIRATSGWERSGSPRTPALAASSRAACSYCSRAQRQIRDPDEHLRDHGGVPALGRRLEGRDAVLAGPRRDPRRGSRAGRGSPRGCSPAPRRRPAWSVARSSCRRACSASPLQRASSAFARASSASASGQATRSAYRCASAMAAALDSSSPDSQYSWACRDRIRTTSSMAPTSVTTAIACS